MVILGIESTAHTFGVGMFSNKVISNEWDMYRPKTGGIHPREAANHHVEVAKEVVKKAMLKKPKAIAYSCGPGIGPCLKVGTIISRYLSNKYQIPLVPVNHGVAHMEVGLWSTKAKDPVCVYASGGNTQIIARDKTWKIYGETLDIALGNALDKLARDLGIAHPGGPSIEKLAKKGEFIDMPYTVKGMDLSYSGIMTHARRLLKTHKPEDVARGFQEHAFAMLVEVTERALAHTEKGEVLLVGGVAKNKRLIEMYKIMCEERGAKFFVVPDELAGDNGAMIAYNGKISLKKGFSIKPEDADYFQNLRVDTDLEKLFRL
ncbi:MAG: tRNA (adenosine(37)-N6)-threonylcarbamoyltransferase complex transferase subunit TsaD [Candidatus Altiarchaeota archaeon]|nr:tRNA (adenosine(37)-N6)-threonylcarbamoyltransferase complex transferase subunit TsaD [Candidatus Altiarchaeota archaeon]